MVQGHVWSTTGNSEVQDRGWALPSLAVRLRYLVAVLVVTAAVGGGAAAAAVFSGDPVVDPVPLPGRCGGVVRERIDSRSLQHVFPGAPPPTFSSEQPTSGPHTPIALAGVQAEPLSPVVQVGLLEEGRILLQYQDLDDTARARLESLAGPEVIVAPGRNLPSRVLATAWTVKVRCDGVDPKALPTFIDRFEGKGLG